MVRRLLNLLCLVEWDESPDDVLVLQKLKDSIRPNHNYAVFLREGKL
jgi:hypothetical protein